MHDPKQKKFRWTAISLGSCRWLNGNRCILANQGSRQLWRYSNNRSAEPAGPFSLALPYEQSTVKKAGEFEYDEMQGYYSSKFLPDAKFIRLDSAQRSLAKTGKISCNEASMLHMNLITDLYKNGLGDLYILHIHEEKIFFGNMSFDKGRLVIKGNKLLRDFKAGTLQPCWESGYLGLVCNEKGHTWESLTFCGIEECDLPVDLSKTRHGALIAAENQYGDKLVDFVGSIYRGYQLMLDNHFLPVVLLKEAKTRTGAPGLIISDLMACPMDISLVRTIFDDIHKSVEKFLILTVTDTKLDENEFNKLFGSYLK